MTKWAVWQKCIFTYVSDFSVSFDINSEISKITFEVIDYWWMKFSTITSFCWTNVVGSFPDWYDLWKQNFLYYVRKILNLVDCLSDNVTVTILSWPDRAKLWRQTNGMVSYGWCACHLSWFSFLHVSANSIHNTLHNNGYQATVLHSK